MHFAIRAPSPEAVKEYFDIALAHGGTERGTLSVSFPLTGVMDERAAG